MLPRYGAGRKLFREHAEIQMRPSRYFHTIEIKGEPKAVPIAIAVRAAPLRQPLTANRPPESPQVCSVARSEPRGLLQQSKNPLDADLLHPYRRALYLPGQEINRRSYTHADRHTQ